MLHSNLYFLEVAADKKVNYYVYLCIYSHQTRNNLDHQLDSLYSSNPIQCICMNTNHYT